MLAATLALALAAQEPPRPSVTAMAGVLYWLQCVVHGADDMLGSDRTTEQIVDIRMRACREHEGRMRNTLRVDLGRQGEAELARYRAMVRDRAISRLTERRQRPTQPPADEKTRD